MENAWYQCNATGRKDTAVPVEEGNRNHKVEQNMKGALSLEDIAKVAKMLYWRRKGAKSRMVNDGGTTIISRDNATLKTL
jgi:hypothetical protein